MEKTAVRRRRIGLLLHVGLLATGIVLPFVSSVSAWIVVLPAVMLVLFSIFCVISVKVIGRQLDAKLAKIKCSSDEETVAFKVKDLADEETGESSIELSGPIGESGLSLQDALPVPQPTYVSKPLVPRSVRTIDLRGAGFAPKLPITLSAQSKLPIEVEDEGENARPDAAVGQ